MNALVGGYGVLAVACASKPYEIKAHALPLFYRTTTPTMVDNKRSYITITQNIEILSILSFN